NVRPAPAFLITGSLCLFACGVLLAGLPRMDPTADPLRPRKSAAYAAMEQVKAALNQKQEPLWLLVSGRTEMEVVQRLAEVQPALSRAVLNKAIAGFALPTALWPNSEFQAANRTLAGDLTGRRESLRQAARTGGFAESALALTEGILNTWKAASAAPVPFWPSNQMCRWIFDKVTSRSPTNLLALGLIDPLK